MGVEPQHAVIDFYPAQIGKGKNFLFNANHLLIQLYYAKS